MRDPLQGEGAGRPSSLDLTMLEHAGAHRRFQRCRPENDKGGHRPPLLFLVREPTRRVTAAPHPGPGGNRPAWLGPSRPGSTAP